MSRKMKHREHDIELNITEWIVIQNGWEYYVTDQKYKTNTAAKSALCKRFGKNTIKAVCSSKTGFIVAAAPTWKGKTFTFPY